jgi:hypothetical protein
MAAKSNPDRFVTDPIPSQDDGSQTEYDKNVERVRAETGNEPPAEPA